MARMNAHDLITDLAGLPSSMTMLREPMLFGGRRPGSIFKADPTKALYTAVRILMWENYVLRRRLDRLTGKSITAQEVAQGIAAQQHGGDGDAA